MRVRWLAGILVVLFSALQAAPPVASAEPIIPAPTRIIFSAPSTGIVVTSGTMVPPAKMIDETSNRCTLGTVEGSFVQFDTNGVITSQCAFEMGDSSFQGRWGSAGMTGTVNRETGAVSFVYSSSVTAIFLGSMNSYDIVIEGQATLPGGYFPTESTGTFTFQRTCGGQGCSIEDSYSYSGTIGFEIDLYPVLPVDLTVDNIIVVQVVETSEPLDASEEKVADRATVARVFVTGDQAVGGVTVELTAERSGVPLAGTPTLIPGGAKSSVVNPDPNQESNSFNFRLPATWTSPGSIQIKARAIPPPGIGDPVPDNNEAFSTPSFLERRRISITYLPVCLSVDSSTTCPASGIEEAVRRLNTFFPLPDEGAIYEKAALPPWVWSEPLITYSDGERLLEALQQRYDLMTLLGLLPGPEQLAAWVPPIEGGALLGIADAAFAGGRGHVSWSQFRPSSIDDSHRVFAHEIAHNYGRRHTAQSDSCGSVDDGTDWPYDTSQIRVQGWDLLTENVVPYLKKDLMSYCSPPVSNLWISKYTYDKLFDAFAPAPIPLTGRAPADVLVIGGSAKADGSGGALDTGYIVHSSQPLDPEDPAPTHCLRFGNSAANDWCFRLTFLGKESGESMEEQAFSLAAPLPASVTRVSLVRIAGNVELASINVSPAAPALAITSPGVGESWNHEQTVAWTLDDADGGTPVGALLYTADGGATWWPLAVDAQATSFTFDTDEIQHGQVQFRVLGSDGFNTTEVLSPVVTVVGPSGDVDCNGTVDGADALSVMRQLAGLSSGKCQTAADVTCSSTIDLADAIDIRRYVAVLPVSLPQGCPAIGVD